MAEGIERLNNLYWWAFVAKEEDARAKPWHLKETSAALRGSQLKITFSAVNARL